MKTYGISGLGADKRVYEHLTLNYEFIPIEWIKPIKNENIVDYSNRLSKVIDLDEPFCLIGVSFGGLVATEMSKRLNPELTILISSAETKNELRSVFRWFGKTGVIKLIPFKLFNPPKRAAIFLFGAKNTQLLKDILNDTDLRFVKWAVHELVNWKNVNRIKNVLKINGTNDKLIPILGDSKRVLIDGGAHFMIVDRAGEISDIINNKIKETTRLICKHS